MMKNDGITLIELIVTITIIGILVIALGFEFTGWIGRYRTESEMKEMYMDLMNTRTRAMTKNRINVVSFPSITQYTIREDTNDDNAVDTTLPTFPKRILHDISRAGGAITTLTITFDARGIIQPSTPLGTTLCLTTTADPDYDCIEIIPTRINMGKLTNPMISGGPCASANCFAQ